LGFAHRARSLAFGATATLAAIKNGKARAVILARDLSTNSAAPLRETARLKNIAVYEFGCKQEFGDYFKRKDVGVIGVMAASFANGIGEILNES
jgi:ribosomal protein L7Ae-like RNA K-turn-binding protein